MEYDVRDFTSEVIERSKEIPVLVDFWAEWCGPCKILGPVLERLAAQANGAWQLAKVNTEELPDVAAQYNIRSIPNVKLFVDGKVETEFVGALPEPMVKQWLAKNIPGKYRKSVEQAEHFIQEGNSQQAQQLLEDVVLHEPGNHKARALLARLLVFTDRGKALSLVTDIEQDSEAYDLAEAIRTFARLAEIAGSDDRLPEEDVKGEYLSAIRRMELGDFAAALEGFISVIRTNRYYDDDGSRKACIAIFKILGEEHGITQNFRREFSRALY
ncbi:MAG: thioredoxin [Bacteroidetes bacterium]|nr:thioredoxin [Bacteroidota bacterium]MCW5895753.1 thioredoxin [Bacteroidota bacterium]